MRISDWSSDVCSSDLAGIVTNHGGTTSHAAIVSRELRVPAIVGTGNATEVIAENQDITISCADGDVGTIYDGTIDFSVTEEIGRASCRERECQYVEI